MSPGLTSVRISMAGPRSLARHGVGARAPVVERVDLVLDFGREADPVEAVGAQAAHGVADLANLAHAGAGGAILDVDERLGLRPRRGAGEKVCALAVGHVEVDGLKRTTADEAAAEVAQDRVFGTLPLLEVEGDFRVVQLQVVCERERGALQDLLEGRAGRAPDALARADEFERAPQR